MPEERGDVAEVARSGAARAARLEQPADTSGAVAAARAPEVPARANCGQGADDCVAHGSGGGGSERVGVRAGPAGLALVERVDRFGVAGREREVEQLEVL